MTAFDSVRSLPVQRLREGLLARSVHGERMTMTVFEVEPGAEVPAHEHDNEQLGLLLEGSLVYRIGEETCELVPGDTWLALPNQPHHVVAGPAGAVFVEIFVPGRDEWRALASESPATPRWPH